MTPVVGVALLIAITVILAAVIGFVVLDTSTSTTKTKNARLDFSGDAASGVTVSHEGGDTFDPANVYYRVNGGTGTSLANITGANIGSTVNTGDTFDVTGLSPNDTITIVWKDPKSDREVQLAKTTVE